MCGSLTRALNLIARWGSGAREEDELRIDHVTNSLNVLDYPHHEVHAGSHFTYSITDSDFDIADALDILIITPDTAKWAHMVVLVEAELDTTVELYENTAALGHGSAAVLNAFNNNRNSLTVNTTTINTSDGGGADGTLIFKSVFGIATGAGANAVTGGGGARSEEEWLLRQNSRYIIRITSGTDNSSMSVKLSWYEHQNRHT